MPHVYSPPNWLYQRSSDTRIKTANGNPASTYAADLDLAYDPNENITGKTTPSGTTSFTYDKLDRIAG